MTKYFMKGTDEEVQFGERIEAVKQTSEGIIKVDVEFGPFWVDKLIEEGIIEVRNFYNEPDEPDYDEEDDEIEEWLEDLDDRLTELEGAVATLAETVTKLITQKKAGKKVEVK